MRNTSAKDERASAKRAIGHARVALFRRGSTSFHSQPQHERQRVFSSSRSRSMRASASSLRNSHRLVRFGSNSPRLAVARAHTRAPAVSEALVRRPRARSDVSRTFAGVRSPRVHARRRARFASSLASALRVPARVLSRTRGHLLASSPQERARRRVRPASSPRIQRAEDALRFPETQGRGGSLAACAQHHLFRMQIARRLAGTHGSPSANSRR
jgi:hypothetical protein